LTGQVKELLQHAVINLLKYIKKELKDGLNKVVSKFKVLQYGKLNGQDLNLESY
jgi:hypothetical protein